MTKHQSEHDAYVSRSLDEHRPAHVQDGSAICVEPRIAQLGNVRQNEVLFDEDGCARQPIGRLLGKELANDAARPLRHAAQRRAIFGTDTMSVHGRPATSGAPSCVRSRWFGQWPSAPCPVHASVQLRRSWRRGAPAPPATAAPRLATAVRFQMKWPVPSCSPPASAVPVSGRPFGRPRADRGDDDREARAGRRSRFAAKCHRSATWIASGAPRAAPSA